jgi:hypothetical protein
MERRLVLLSPTRRQRATEIYIPLVVSTPVPQPVLQAELLARIEEAIVISKCTIHALGMHNPV